MGAIRGGHCCRNRLCGTPVGLDRLILREPQAGFAGRPTEMAAEDHSGQLHQRLFGEGQHAGLLRWNWVLGWRDFPEHHLICTGVVRQIVPGIYQRRFAGGQLQFWTGRQAATLPAVPDQCGDLDRDRHSCNSSQLFLGGAVVHLCKGQYSCGKNRPSWFPNRCDQLFDDGDQCVYFRMVHTLSDGRTSFILSFCRTILFMVLSAQVIPRSLEMDGVRLSLTVGRHQAFS